MPKPGPSIEDLILCVDEHCCVYYLLFPSVVCLSGVFDHYLGELIHIQPFDMSPYETMMGQK
jgi:hypothetical protein